MILGIDVSHYNGKIDWEKVKMSGKEFAFIRIGWSGYEGEIHIDKEFHNNMRNAVEAGINVGVYVYAYNKHPDSAKITASEILKILKDNNYNPLYPIAFDLEESKDKCLTSQGKANLWKTGLAFLNEIKKGGFTPIIYSYTAFIMENIDMQKLSEYDLWVADYRAGIGEICPYKGDFTIWQYSGNDGRCDGVIGGCDLNVCYKDYVKPTPINDTTDYKRLYEELLMKLNKIRILTEEF